MVTWSRSFVVALKIFVVSILWYIVGLIIAMIGVAALGIGVVSKLSTPPRTPEEAMAYMGTLGIAFVFLLIGGIVAGFGALATFVKFIVEEAIEEYKRELGGPYPPPYPVPPPPPAKKR